MKIAARSLLAVCLLAAATLAGEAKSPLDRALEAFEAGEFEAALQTLRAVPADDPLRPRADYLKGETELILGDPEAAEASFRAVLAKKPKAVPALTGLARALLRRKKTEEAEKTARRATDLGPKDARAWLALGEALDAAGRRKEAGGALARAAKLAKDDPEVMRGLVLHHLAANDTKAARAVAARCVKRRPDHPMGWFLTGLVLERAKEDEKAIRAYEKAIEKDDAFLDAHKNLAILCHTLNPLYQDAERTKKALHHYERYFELGGKDPELEKLYRTMKSFLESRSGK